MVYENELWHSFLLAFTDNVYITYPIAGTYQSMALRYDAFPRFELIDMYKIA